MLGRLRVIKELSSKNKFSLSVGSKNTRFASINLDVDPRFSPDIVADAAHLPFRPGVFEQIFFTDVIEHLSKKKERRALREINRTLCEKGELILTTPNDKLLFTVLDPALYVRRHRHYKRTEIVELLEAEGFKVIEFFTAGWLWQCINELIYCFVTYPLKRALNRSFPHVPYLLQKLEDKEYIFKRDNGYTIFIKALKVQKDQ